jgi:hypothetical protein
LIYFKFKVKQLFGEWFLECSSFRILKEKWDVLETKLIGTVRFGKASSNDNFKAESLTINFLKMLLIEGKSCFNEADERANSITQVK